MQRLPAVMVSASFDMTAAMHRMRLPSDGLRGCLMEMGMSMESALTTALVVAVLSTGLSFLTFAHTRFLVTGSERLGGSCEDRIYESMSISRRTRTRNVTPPRNRRTAGMSC